ncbi:NAD(P)H-dependent oxidoreductase [Pelagicoccus sp. SDUM812005]|uniref:NADPH-dependent FMN reductase n=1 Tax=Pelagicoccus sp. SDUM812005 TaxID=3041257 RepID=UPI00280F2979|nr:NAD(P)H-dependent oxidoreductase [Pelagicoccus sp. SDUM812005]MDQ8180781.1 NAD(P)H-dependent oxidoreductase [Pelagicoccus sp. SDUM812005]
MKVLAFGASTSSTSINRQLANFAASLVPGAQVTQLDLRSYRLPIYSADEEKANGVPSDAKAFLAAIRSHDALVVSLAEHNGSYAAAFKNLYDWASRAEQKVWAGKPMLLLSTSPGGRGGASVLEAAKATFPRMGADLKATFSLPSFPDSFDPQNGITDPMRLEFLRNACAQLTST